MPVYPLDGGRVLQTLLWPRMGYGRSTSFASGIGMVGAVLIGLAGFLTETPILYFIAVFGYLTCWQQRQQLKVLGETETGAFGYDFSQGYTSLETSDRQEPKRPGFFARRRRRRETQRREREQREAEERTARLDRTLAKVRARGLASLTSTERRFLEQETQRRQASKNR